MKHITQLNELPDGLVLVDFYATWCGPCRMLAPVLEQIESIEVIKVDVDQAEELAKEFAIQYVPTLIIFKDKVELSRKTGYFTLDDLNNWIKEF